MVGLVFIWICSGANQLYDVPKEIMSVIPEHWGNFPPQERTKQKHTFSNGDHKTEIKTLFLSHNKISVSLYLTGMLWFWGFLTFNMTKNLLLFYWCSSRKIAVYVWKLYAAPPGSPCLRHHLLHRLDGELRGERSRHLHLPQDKGSQVRNCQWGMKIYLKGAKAWEIWPCFLFYFTPCMTYCAAFHEPKGFFLNGLFYADIVFENECTNAENCLQSLGTCLAYACFLYAYAQH